MGPIKVAQKTAIQIKGFKTPIPESIKIPENPPFYLWVVWVGEEVRGIFTNWPEASAFIDVLEQEQNMEIANRKAEIAAEKLEEKKGGKLKI